MSTIDLHDDTSSPISDRLRRRTPSLPRRLWLVVALAGLLAIAGLIVYFTTDIGRARPTQPAAIVPDLLLSQSWDANSGEMSSVHAFWPKDQTVSALPGVQLQANPIVSPDGRQVVISGWLVTDDTVSTVLYAFDSSTMAEQWHADLLSEPVDPDSNRTVSKVAISSDRVYVASHRWQSSDPIELTVLDRATGAQVARVDLTVADPAANQPSVYINRAGTELYLLFGLWNGPPDAPTPGGTGYVRFALPDLQELDRRMPLSTSPLAATGWGGLLGTDTPVLYSTISGGETVRPRVRFLDLAAGQELPSLTIPFTNPSGLFQQGISPDGTRLYVFDPVAEELAVVDAATRTIEQHVSVDMTVGAVGDATAQQTAAGGYFYFGGSPLQLSPDGAMLYAIGVSATNGVNETRGVLVIDTRTWQVVDRWLVDTHPWQMIVGGDGHYLYVQTVSWGADGRNEFRIVDTTTGQDDFTVDLPSGTIWSLAGLYQDTWGRAPAIEGVDPKTIRESASGKVVPFARLDIAVSKANVISGDPVTVEVRFLDPKSGEVVRDGQDGVRFAPPDHVQATFSRGADRSKDMTIVLAQAEYGVYRGAARLPGVGGWSLTVTARTSGEPLRRINQPSAVVVQPAAIGSDGNRYALHITTDPQTPVRDEEFTLYAEFVDVHTGAPIPGGVTLPNGAPDTIAISLLPANGSGVTTTKLLPDGDGTYSGTATVWLADVWQINANYDGDGSDGSVPVVSIEVGAP